MEDIFISYTRRDRDRVLPVIRLLKDEGWTVWWAPAIEPGKEWRPTLDEKLVECGAVVVIWSAESIKSDWVKYEAKIAYQQRKLIPIMLDLDQIPKEYKHIQATNLFRWKGNPKTHATEIESLMRGIAELVSPSQKGKARPGYDPNFLGETHTIKLPSPPGMAVVLPYMHFTVVSNPSRRLAYYVAYNSDTSKSISRFRTNDWGTDPLIPKSQQMDLPLLLHSGYDRGHIMSWSTGCWGSPREAAISARQAFYWPNIAPQHPQFNRIWWYVLEEWERQIAKSKGKLTGFSGPVFLLDDEPFRDEIELEGGLIAHGTFRLPHSYWKVIVTTDSSERLSVAAFLMDQNAMLKQGLGTKISLDDFRIKLSDLQLLTDIRFPQSLYEADLL